MINNHRSLHASGRNSRAFTIVEVLVITAVLGVILAIIIPNFSSSTAQSKLASCESNLINTGRALESYADDHEGSYPDSLDVLLKENYIPKLPECPSSGEVYAYEPTAMSESEGDGFLLYCKGTFHSKVKEDTNHPAFSNAHGLCSRKTEGTDDAKKCTCGQVQTGGSEDSGK